MNQFAEAIKSAFEEHKSKKDRGIFERPKGGKISLSKMFGKVSTAMQDLEEQRQKVDEAISVSTFNATSVYRPLFSRNDQREAFASFNRKGKTLYRCSDCLRSVSIRCKVGLLHCRFCGGEHSMTNAHYYFSPSSFPKGTEKDFHANTFNKGVK
jgi:ribosomal protein L37AE/L43A